jgi:hypothetical protein
MKGKKRFDYLYDRMSNKGFLNSLEKGDELPFYICPYEPDEKFKIIEETRLLKKKLFQEQIKVVECDLFEMTVERCKERKIWDKLKNGKKNIPKDRLKKTLQNIMAPDTHLKEIMREKYLKQEHDLIFITGIGEVYPFLRTHSILNNLQSIIQDKPVVVFFPGKYTYHPTNGTTLELFGRLHNDRFYRAFNIYEH